MPTELEVISDQQARTFDNASPDQQNLRIGEMLQSIQLKINEIIQGGGGGLSLASQAEAEGGTENTKAMTALRVMQEMTARIIAGNNITKTAVPGGIQIDASASGSSEYIFWPNAPLQVGNVFKVWADLMTAIAALPEGIPPKVTFRESFTIPVGTYDMRLGTWFSPIIATGAVTVTVPDGVIIKNLIGIENGLGVEVQPTTADGMFLNDILGGLTIFVEALGSRLWNTGSKALFASPNQVVYVRNNSSNIGVGPASTAPIVKMTGAAVLLAILFGESPNSGWENGDFEGVVGADLYFIHGVHFNMPTIAGWLGNTPVQFNDSQAKNLIYDDTAQSPASGATTTQGVIDWLKTQVGGAAYSVVFDPSAATETPNLKNTFQSLMARVSALSPEPVKIIVRKAGLNQVISVPTTGMPGPGWDFSLVSFEPSPDSPGVLLDFADGTYMQEVPRSLNGVQMQFNETTTPVASITGAAIVALDSAGFKNQGSQPIFQVNGGFLYFVVNGVFAPITKLGSAECVDIQSGSIQMDIITQTLANGFLSANNQISGPGGSATFNIYTLVPGGYNRTDANFSGTTTVNKLAETRVTQLIAQTRDFLQLTPLTVAQRNALSVTEGAICSVSDGATKEPQYYDGTSWRSITIV